ncbi:hypothetical protein J2129_001250 [Methanofollis sp. W23]|nr:hypothetical protein [Methanofollis sp. W23]
MQRIGVCRNLRDSYLWQGVDRTANHPHARLGRGRQSLFREFRSPMKRRDRGDALNTVPKDSPVFVGEITPQGMFIQYA